MVDHARESAKGESGGWFHKWADRVSYKIVNPKREIHSPSWLAAWVLTVLPLPLTCLLLTRMEPGQSAQRLWCEFLAGLAAGAVVLVLLSLLQAVVLGGEEMEVELLPFDSWAAELNFKGVVHNLDEWLLAPRDWTRWDGAWRFPIFFAM